MSTIRPLLPPPMTPTGLNLDAWGAQQNFWTERMRGCALVWPRTSTWFVNDPLGPLPHSHPGASEIYFVANGMLEVTVGGQRFEMQSGDFCLIPADAFHDPRGTAGTDLGLFCVVAPNWRDQRWQTEDFPPHAVAAEPRVSSAWTPGPLPSDELLSSECLDLAPGETEQHGVVRGAERVLYVLAGRMSLAVDNLTGELGAHQYAHVPSNVRHRVISSGPEPLRYLSVWSTER